MTTATIDELGTRICTLLEYLPVMRATIADIEEAEVLARAVIALRDQKEPQRLGGSLEIAYWEDRIALFLAMKEAISFLTLRLRRNQMAIVILASIVLVVNPLHDQARAMRQQIQRAPKDTL